MSEMVLITTSYWDVMDYFALTLASRRTPPWGIFFRPTKEGPRPYIRVEALYSSDWRQRD
jgi:hypothetical protein